MLKSSPVAHRCRFAIATALALATIGMSATTNWKFNFGTATKAGYTTVTPAYKYNLTTGYGFDFDDGQAVQYNAKKDGIQGKKAGKNAFNWTGLPFYAPTDSAFFFSVRLPRGNYEVKITMGDQDSAVRATVRAEQRRLMIEDWRIAAGKSETRTIHVNRRSDTVPGTKTRISLTTREQTYVDLDNRLTIEFNGNHPVLQSLEIAPVDTDITVYLCGNSTVVDQPQEPWSTWGMNFPRFFKAGVTISDQAESGLTSASFLAGRRLDNVLASLKAGDYVFVEFGHNDEKSYDAVAYKGYLLKFITQVKAKGGLPVIVSPTARLSFSGGKAVNTHGAFPDSAKSLATQQNVPYFDMTGMSTRFIDALGSSNASKAYTYFAANMVPNQTSALKDGTHWNGYGGYELAKAMASEVKRQNLTFAKYLSDDFVAFDPSVPDPYASFALPFSPFLGAYEVPDSAVSGRMASFRLRANVNKIESASIRSGVLAVRYDGPQDGLELRVVDLDGSLLASRITQGEDGLLRVHLLEGSAHRVHLVELVRDGIVLDQRRVLP
jgi:lysophospholipase L1-like esterase